MMFDLPFVLAQIEEPGGVGNMIDLITDGGLIGLLVVIVMGSLKEWWVPGVTYRRALEDAEEWRKLALEGTSVASEAVSLVSDVRPK